MLRNYLRTVCCALVLTSVQGATEDEGCAVDLVENSYFWTYPYDCYEYGDPSTIAVGCNITFICHDGYALRGLSTLTCKENGQLDGTAPVCSDTFRCYTCKNAGSNENCNDEGYEVCESPQSGACENHVHYNHGSLQLTKRCRSTDSCNDKQQNSSACREVDAVNSNCFYCCYNDLCNEAENATGTETPTYPGPKCIDALAPSRGSVECTNGDYPGSRCTYSCNEGCELSIANASSQCSFGNNEATWNGKTPECIGDCNGSSLLKHNLIFVVSSWLIAYSLRGVTM